MIPSKIQRICLRIENVLNIEIVAFFDIMIVSIRLIKCISIV